MPTDTHPPLATSPHPVPRTALGGLAFYGLQLTLRTEKPLKDHFHGNVLRGWLGQSLLNAVNCPYPEPRCLDCKRRHDCAFPQVFKPELLQESRLPPFLIHRWQRHEADAHRLTVTVIVLATALPHLLTWLLALHGAAGKQPLGEAGAVSLIQAVDLGSETVLLDATAATPLPARFAWQPLALRYPPRLVGDATLTIRIVDLFASKHSTADDLFGLALRTRLQRLIKDYGDGTRLDYAAPLWRVRRNGLRLAVKPLDDRRSVRGWRGELVIDQLTPLGRDLLALGYYLHVGAQTSCGLGGFTWRIDTKK